MRILYAAVGLPLALSSLVGSPLQAETGPSGAESTLRAPPLPDPEPDWQEPIETPPATVDAPSNRGVVREVAPVQCDACAPRGTRIGNHWRTVTKPHLQYSHWGYADQFQVRPFGSYMRGALNTQISNGVVAQIALYRFDFLDAQGDPADRLSERGRLQLEKTIGLMQMCDAPLIIEPSGESREFDDARRANVLAEIHSLGLAIPDDRVLIGRPLPRGLTAAEANRVYYNANQDFGSSGTSAPVSPSSGPNAAVSPVSIPPVSP